MVKIIIIGAGISGLSTYLFLRKHLLRNGSNETDVGNKIEIKIYEAYDIHASKFNSTLLDTLAGGRNSEQQAPSIPRDETQPIFTPQAIGSAIGISKNGLSVLSRLDDDDEDNDNDETPAGGGRKLKSKRGPSIMRQLATHGHPIDCWQISTARGFKIVDVKLGRTNTDNKDRHSQSKRGEPRTRPSSSEGSGTTEQTDLYRGIMIARQSCWEILRDRVLEIAPDIISRRKVTDVEIGDETSPNIIIFEDGSRELADLVIGADGLRSVLRRAMFQGRGEDESSQAQPNGGGGDGGRARRTWLQLLNAYLPFTQSDASAVAKPDFISPRYEGLVGVGGFIPSSVLESAGHKPGTMSIVFGPNGFFGYGYLTSAAAAAAEEEEEQPPLSSIEPGETSSEMPVSRSTKDPTIGPLSVWWSTFSSPTPYPYSHSNTHSTPPAHAQAQTQAQTQTQTQTQTFDKRRALKALLQRHSTWKNAPVSAIIEYVSTHALEHEHENGNGTEDSYAGAGAGKALDACYPTWTTPELPTWARGGRAVLVGDAAHALQPSSGQGACQGLEDAEALVLFLKRYLSGVPSSSSSSSPSPSSSSSPQTAPTAIAIATPATDIKADADATTPLLACASDDDGLIHTRIARALAAYHAFRAPRVHQIYVRSQKMAGLKSDMNVVMEYTMYFFIWMMTWRWLSWWLSRLGFSDLERHNEELFGYDLPGEVETFLARNEIKGEARIVK
jgi:2-polyprenyl-6-methoxyphenol hydroxylase-like FAD-dependent oxidoreductase